MTLRDVEQLDPRVDFGELQVAGPPWILGHRGSPREAPENTLVSLKRALAHGLDGVEYDVRSSIEGEPLLLHDETVTRTTDGVGPVDELALTELLQLDAGGWFHKRFAGEPLPLLEEALALEASLESPDDGPGLLHMVELKSGGLVERVDQLVREQGLERRVRIASFRRDVCLAARDRGLPAMLLAVEPDESDRAFVLDERIEAYGLGAKGWRTPLGALDWPCERWAWSVDSPEDLLDACRRPLFGFNTNEPRRALAVRALVALAPDDDGPYPLRVPRLDVDLGQGDLGRRNLGQGTGDAAEWTGHWRFDVVVRNPLPFPVETEVGFVGRHGVYDVAGDGTDGRLGPGEERTATLELTGGSRSPGVDPALMLRLSWPDGVGRPAGELILDAPVVRSRTARLRDAPQRLPCLNETPRSETASVVVERNGRALLVRLEADGGLRDAQVVVHLDGYTRYGTRGLRLPLPEDFDDREGGVPFSVAVVGRDPQRPAAGPVHRRWCGGLPADLLSGEPGRLTPSV